MTGPYNGTELLDSLAAFIGRFVALSAPAQAHALALWVLHTWTLPAADVSPYVVVTSPEKKCGKTRLLDVLALLVARVWRIDAAPTEAVLFRAIDSEKPTLLLDEADALFAGSRERTEPLRAIFNSGNRRGATVPRCEGKSMAVRNFSIFGPKLLAGINAARWPDTIRDRAVIIELRRRREDEAVERFRHREVKPRAATLADRCERWSEANIDALREAWPELPDALDDRAADSWEPMLAIADLAGDDWASRARSAALELSAGRDADDDGSLGVRLLADVREVFVGAQNISTETLLERLNGLEESPWRGWQGRGLDARTLGSKLRPYGIRSRTVRLTEDSTLKGYKREQFSDAFARYLPGLHEPSQASPVSSHRNGDVTDVTDVTAAFDSVPSDEERADAELERIARKFPDMLEGML